MDRAARLLAKGWYKAWRGWWWATSAALAVVLVLVLGTAGLLEGMEQETQRRVGDFYTGDLRITADRAGAAPPSPFAFNGTQGRDDALEGLQDAAGPGAVVLPRVETTYLLSRRTLVEAYLFEDDQFGVALPGVASDEDAYGVGVLAGLPLDDAAARDLLRPYLVTGSFPQADPGNDTVPILLSVRQFHSLLSPAERDGLEGLPSAGQLASLKLEITAARVDESGPFKDILRFPARVTGLYSSGIHALDSITVIAPIEDARRLLGAEPGGAEVNAISIHGDEGSAEAVARQNGWVTEGSSDFTQRYLGQLVNVVRILGLGLSLLLMVFPLFMVWVGLSQQLERSRREMAVCRAIGMPDRSIRRALQRLVVRVVLAAALPVALLLVAASFLLPPVLQAATALPFPLGFALPLWAILLAAADLVVAAVVALGGALRRQGPRALSASLRTL